MLRHTVSMWFVAVWSAYGVVIQIVSVVYLGHGNTILAVILWTSAELGLVAHFATNETLEFASMAARVPNMPPFAAVVAAYVWAMLVSLASILIFPLPCTLLMF